MQQIKAESAEKGDLGIVAEVSIVLYYECFSHVMSVCRCLHAARFGC